jgi:hypothetical protein
MDPVGIRTWNLRAEAVEEVARADAVYTLSKEVPGVSNFVSQTLKGKLIALLVRVVAVKPLS